MIPRKIQYLFIGYCSVQSMHIKLLGYLCAGQYQMEQAIHDININFYNFSISLIKVIYKVLPSAAFFGTVKFFSYMIILDNSKNSVPSIQIVMEFHSNPLQDLRHDCLNEIYSQLLLNLRVWNKAHLDDHLGCLNF